MTYHFRLIATCPPAPGGAEEYDFLGNIVKCEAWLQDAIRDYHDAIEDDPYGGGTVADFYMNRIDTLSEDIRRLKAGIPVEGI